MKASEFIMAKAIEHDDNRLVKIAFDIYETDNDYELVKEAAIGVGLLAGARKLLGSNVVRNAAIGAGVGAGTGAIEAGEGNRMRGVLRGAAVGGAMGGLGTAGVNIGKSMKAGQTFGQAFKGEGAALKQHFQKSKRAFDIGRAGKAPAPNAATPTPPTPGASPSPKPDWTDGQKRQGTGE